MLQVLRVAQRSNQNKISFRMGVVWSDAVVVSTGTGEAGEPCEDRAVDNKGFRGAGNRAFEAITKGHVSSVNPYHSSDLTFLLCQMRTVEALSP